MKLVIRCSFVFVLTLIFVFVLNGQSSIRWAKEGSFYYQIEGGELIQYTLPANTKSIFIGDSELILFNGH